MFRSLMRKLVIGALLQIAVFILSPIPILGTVARVASMAV